MADYSIKEGLGSAVFDVFCTANFLNFVPWRACIDVLLGIGITTIEEHNRALVHNLVSKMDRSKYCLVSPSEPSSAIVVLSHVKRERNPVIYGLLSDAGVDIALRNNNLRLSLHLYNTSDDAARTVSVLNSAA